MSPSLVETPDSPDNPIREATGLYAVADEQILRAQGFLCEAEARAAATRPMADVAVNDQATELLGAPIEQVLGRRIEDFIARENWPVLESLWAAFKADEKQHGAYEVLRADGFRTMVEYLATWNFGPGQHLLVAREIGRRQDQLWDGACAPLTSRERKLLQLAADGRSPPAIADALYLSPHTVRTHLQHIHAKLGVRDRASPLRWQCDLDSSSDPDSARQVTTIIRSCGDGVPPVIPSMDGQPQELRLRSVNEPLPRGGLRSSRNGPRVGGPPRRRPRRRADVRQRGCRAAPRLAPG